MALPLIATREDGLGFAWRGPDGSPLRLAEVVALPGAEPHRWLPTHLEALDDVLIEVASRFGEVLGGGRPPTPHERDPLLGAARAIDRLTWEYGEAARGVDLPDDPRAGQILGTGALMSICARGVLGLMGPTPFEGELDDPTTGLVSGHARLVQVDAARPWLGARWLIETLDGRRLPADLPMLLHDSSGVDKEATLREHREALAGVIAAVGVSAADPPSGEARAGDVPSADAAPPDPDSSGRSGSGRRPFVGDRIAASGALDWLLFDWLLAHRESDQGGAIVFAANARADAALVVDAAVGSVRLRATFDPSVIAPVEQG